MRMLGNILWYFPFLGFITAAWTWLLGLLLTVLVITAPIGLGLMQYGKFLFLPFSWSMVDGKDLKRESNSVWSAYSTIIMILYLPIGLISVVVALFQIVALALTIVGIPTALVLAKSLGTFLNPVGKVCVHHYVKDDIDRSRALGR
ncbi:MAG: hypothetical protein K9H25_12300 [Rhodospirillum sp.]|nr:hypothetical protein [Rhodospirillum sp.]MCF8490033.1 hypothetical protein [Rhodospirillum sp.]MCF8499562.1 hypothetical protein [Rhodospirillum sp.]